MKFQKLLAPLMAVSLVAGAMPIANVSAESKPKIYVDLTYEEDGDIRADIIMENMPTICGGAFHIDLGDSWVLSEDNTGHNTTFPSDTSIKENYSQFMFSEDNMKIKDDGIHGAFFVFTEPYLTNCDYNGKLFSIYVAKGKNFNSENAGINIVYTSSGEYSDYLYHVENDNSLTDLSPNVHKTSPVMLEAHEYIVGDVNNDGMVNAVDSTCIFTALKSQDNSYNVNDIKYTYKSLFPDALCAAAPDANSDGTIEHNDAMLIMQYYADLSTSHENHSGVGRRDIYEIFND